jgi:GAF domain-containing protein
MTPSVTEIMRGCAMALTQPPSPDAGPEFFASRVGMISMLANLAAQEAEHAASAAAAENTDMRALFAQAEAHDAALGGRLGTAARETDPDLSLTALDAANARLRRLLIELHERVEDAGDAGLDRAILALYVRMAEGRRLQLGG